MDTNTLAKIVEILDAMYGHTTWMANALLSLGMPYEAGKISAMIAVIEQTIQLKSMKDIPPRPRVFDAKFEFVDNPNPPKMKVGPQSVQAIRNQVDYILDSMSASGIPEEGVRYMLTKWIIDLLEQEDKSWMAK